MAPEMVEVEVELLHLGLDWRLLLTGEVEFGFNFMVKENGILSPKEQG